MRLKHFSLAALLLGAMALPSFAQSQQTSPPLPTEIQDLSYDDYMRLGYDATQREEYRTALNFFEQALELRPNDYYAIEAIENVSTYLAN
jgi:tetratricopeptide (TPR) repeat protein